MEMGLSEGILGGSAEKPTRVLMQGGVWCVPKEERPKGWEGMAVKEPNPAANGEVQSAPPPAEPSAAEPASAGGKWKWLIDQLLGIPMGEHLEITVPKGETASGYASKVRATLVANKATRAINWSVRQCFDEEEPESEIDVIRILRGDVRTGIGNQQENTGPHPWRRHTQPQQEPAAADDADDPSDAGGSIVSVTLDNQPVEYIPSQPPKIEEFLSLSLQLSGVRIPELQPEEAERMVSRQDELADSINRYREAKKKLDDVVGRVCDWERFTDERDGLLRALLPSVHKLLMAEMETADRRKNQEGKQ